MKKVRQLLAGILEGREPANDGEELRIDRWTTGGNCLFECQSPHEQALQGVLTCLDFVDEFLCLNESCSRFQVLANQLLYEAGRTLGNNH